MQEKLKEKNLRTLLVKLDDAISERQAVKPDEEDYGKKRVETIEKVDSIKEEISTHYIAKEEVERKSGKKDGKYPEFDFDAHHKDLVEYERGKHNGRIEFAEDLLSLLSTN